MVNANECNCEPHLSTNRVTVELDNLCNTELFLTKTWFIYTEFGFS